MRLLLCALAALALLRAAGADGEWGPDGRGPGETHWAQQMEEGGTRKQPDGERDGERGGDGERKRRENDRKGQRNKGRRLERGQREEEREQGRV